MFPQHDIPLYQRTLLLTYQPIDTLIISCFYYPFMNLCVILYCWFLKSVHFHLLLQSDSKYVLKNCKPVFKIILWSHQNCFLVSISIRIKFGALSEWLWDGGQQLLWRRRGGGGRKRLCHVKHPLQLVQQHVSRGSPWRQGWDSTWWDNKA